VLEKTGQRMPVEDGYIAEIVRRHGLTIATGNDQDFRLPGLQGIPRQPGLQDLTLGALNNLVWDH